MTGLAKFAWIITFVLIAWLLCATAHAASPRDAIKQLPKFSHRSELQITENDTPADPLSFGHKERYSGNWRIDWVPGSLKLPGGIKASAKLHYITILSDQLDKVRQTSSDSRRETYNVSLDLNSPKRFKASFTIDRNDTYNSNANSNDLIWKVEQKKSTNFSWTPPRLPLIAFGQQTTSTYHYIDGKRTSASNVDWTQYKLDYRDDTGTFGQRFLGLVENRATRNYITGKGNNSDKSRFEGYRLIPMANAGALTLSYFYEDAHNSDSGKTDVTSTAVSRVGMNWKGDTKLYPLTYNFSYTSELADFSNQTRARTITNRLLGLNFKPPVPDGKSASLAYTYQNSEYEDANRETSNENQKLVWNFSPNQRVQSNISFEVKNATNETLGEHTDERELLSGGFVYKIPGSGGSFNGSFTQEIQRQPTQGFRRIANGVNLSSNFKLSPMANMTMFYNQLYNDSRDSPIGLPASSENLVAGVKYNLRSNYGLELSATWKQHYRAILPSEQRTDSQSIELVVSYQTSAKWKYTFSLNSNDTTSTPSNLPLGRSYSMGDDIKMIINYQL